jgi:hypothetical protein
MWVHSLCKCRHIKKCTSELVGCYEMGNGKHADRLMCRVSFQLYGNPKIPYLSPLLILLAYMIQLPNKELIRPKFLYPVLRKTSRVFFPLHDRYALAHGSREFFIRLSEDYCHYDHLSSSCQ